GIAFTDAAEYDGLHHIQTALARFDRPAAQTAFDLMRAGFPDHRLTRMARVALARYDANPTLLLRALDGLVEAAPGESTFLLAKINVLRDLGRRDERLAMTREQLERPDGDPLFAQHYAQLILPDPHYHAEGTRIMRRAIRKRPYAAVAYYFLA